MFEIHLEWEEAPGVRESLLAQTWARLELRLNGKPLTKYWSDRTQSIRDGVYGSVFPLADWIASNWWNLLHEGLRHHPSELSARTERIRAEEARSWLRRHNLMTCREGMAYPDLTIHRREDEVALCWFPDPASTTTRGRFMDEGMVSLDRAMVETALESLMERVLERIHDSEDGAARALRELWAAISESRRDREEAALCQRLAMFGQDPYAEDLSDALEEMVEQLSFADEVIQDLLSATTPQRLAQRCERRRDPPRRSTAVRGAAWFPHARAHFPIPTELVALPLRLCSRGRGAAAPPAFGRRTAERLRWARRATHGRARATLVNACRIQRGRSDPSQWRGRNLGDGTCQHREALPACASAPPLAVRDHGRRSAATPHQGARLAPGFVQGVRR